MTADCIRTFAESIFIKCSAINRGCLETKEISKIRESISTDIQKYGDLIPVSLISQRAYEQAKAINLSLKDMTWHNQIKFDPGRKIFQYEHMMPVNELRKLCLQRSDVKSTIRLLREQHLVAWILKEEDQEITRLGYKQNRPDPQKAYREAGIKLITI